MNPPLTWVGGKRWHAPDVARRFDGQCRLVELFCGSCAVTFALDPYSAMLVDANPHLINFYEQWQRGIDPAWTGDTTDPYETYWSWRRSYNQLTRDGGDERVRAELFYFLNHFAFNSLWRVNRDGAFNVPPRPNCRQRTLPVLERFPANKNWLFECRDFRLAVLRPTDFVYADPPYDDGFTTYTEGGFTWDDQQELALLLAAHPGPVMLINKATPRIVELYHDLGFDLEYPESTGQHFHRSRGRRDDVLEVCALRHVLR